MNIAYNELYKIIEKYKNKKIIIATHVSPDPDAIGAGVSLCLSLISRGYDAYVAIDEVKKKFQFLLNEEVRYVTEFDNTIYDLLIMVDCGEKYMIDYTNGLFDKAEEVINIDHHMSNSNYGNYNIVETECSSTSELMYKILKANDIKITSEMGFVIYAGIIFDTGGFRHSSTSSNTMNIAGELINIGVPFTDIHNILFASHTKEEAEGFNLVLGNVKYAFDDKVCYTTVTQEELKNLGLTTDAISGRVSYLIGTEGVQCAFMATEHTDGKIKVSFRSHDIDVNEVAGYFGGGGHTKASGCAIEDTMENAVNRILERLGNVL